MIYYGIVSCAVVMFSFMFLFSQRYERESGTGTRQILKFNIGANVAGLIVLLIINMVQNGELFGYTPFSAIVSFVAAVNLLLYTFCSINSLGKINLSLYSVICMLGGMALPFVAGIIFWHEELTLGKIICFITVVVALLITVQKGEKKSGWIYYVGIFVLNGMSGVIAKFYSLSDYKKAGDAGYSAQIALYCVLICTVLLLLNKEKNQKITKKALVFSAGYGLLSDIGNFLALIGFSKLPASAQCPFTTGGVMIVSTIICFFTPNKPSKREIAAVVLSFAGIIALITL